MSSSPSKASPVGSVDRALRIIELLSHNGRGMTLDELALQAELPHSSMHRLLGALKHRGFASQPEPNGRYFLGTSLLAAAFRFHDGLDLRQMVHPLLARVHERYNETVHLGVLTGSEIIYLDKIEAIRPIKLTSVIGGRNPAHCTGLGKALLAWTYPTDDELKEWIARNGPLEKRQEGTFVTPAELCEEMARCRAQGYALDLSENELGVSCAAVPLFLGGTKPEAAMSLSAPDTRMPEADLREVAAFLHQLESEAFLTAREADETAAPKQ